MEEGIFPRRLTEQRKYKKLSQKQAAKDLGISQALLSHYEKGVRECGLSFVVKAANYYGVSCDYLLGNSNSTIQIEEDTHIIDIPEDKEMSPDTIVRAAIAISTKMSKDPSLMRYLLQVYGLGTYFVLYGGIKSGALPKTWVDPGAFSHDRIAYLSSTVVAAARELEASESKTHEDEKVPACISTITSWANDYLNISIANLL